MGVFLTLHGQMCFRRPEAKLLLITWLNDYGSCFPLHHQVMGQGGARRAVLCQFYFPLPFWVCLTTAETTMSFCTMSIIYFCKVKDTKTTNLGLRNI